MTVGAAAFSAPDFGTGTLRLGPRASKRKELCVPRTMSYYVARCQPRALQVEIADKYVVRGAAAAAMWPRAHARPPAPTRALLPAPRRVFLASAGDHFLVPSGVAYALLNRSNSVTAELAFSSFVSHARQ